MKMSFVLGCFPQPGELVCVFSESYTYCTRSYMGPFRLCRYTVSGTCTVPELPEKYRTIQQVCENAICTRVLSTAW